MSVQWFPGHMHLTRQALVERLRATDVVIELLDARLPGSSANPLLAALAGHKPGLKLLNKSDLADEARTQAWLDWYNAQQGIRAMSMQAVRAAPAQQLIAACRTLAPLRKGVARPMRVLVCGVPNVGKSTLINSLAGKRRAATGDEAGITRQEQRIVLEDDFYLYDTPGLLWPRIAAPQVGFNLAASGAVGRNAFDDEEVALELLERLNPHYLDALNVRYKIRCDAAQPADVLLEAIGRSRGAVGSGGRVHMEKAAGIVIHDFRSGAIGRITLETPPQYMQWTAQAQERDAARQQEREQRQSARTSRRKKR